MWIHNRVNNKTSSILFSQYCGVLVLEFALALYESLHLVVSENVTLTKSKSKSGKKSKKDAEFASTDNAVKSIALHFDALLDILAILLEKLVPILNEEGNEDMRAATVESFELSPLAELLPLCKSDLGVAAIYHIGRHVLAENFVALSTSCQEGIVQGNKATPTQACMLDCFFAWGLAGNVNHKYRFLIFFNVL